MMSNLRPGTETGKWALRDATGIPIFAACPLYRVQAGPRCHWSTPPYMVWSSYGSMIGVTMVAEYTGLRARIFCTNLLLRKITTLSTELETLLRRRSSI
jgi:hypothetical protein